MVESESTFRIRELGFAAWERMKEREASWLIATGRMPPQESGRYAVEVERWQIFPTYDLATAAKVLGVDERLLYDGVLSGEIEYLTVYEMIIVPFSGLVSFAAAQPTHIEMPAGGGWMELPAEEWWRLHWERARRLRSDSQHDPRTLEMIEEVLERDERNYLTWRPATSGDAPAEE